MTTLNSRKEIFVIFLFLFVFVNNYSYPDMIGDDINATMYVDEPVCFMMRNLRKSNRNGP
jgi:hypothetical protein